MSLIQRRSIPNRLTIRLSDDDVASLNEIATKIKCSVSDLTRYAIRKHIVLARKKLEENPDIWG